MCSTVDKPSFICQNHIFVTLKEGYTLLFTLECDVNDDELLFSFFVCVQHHDLRIVTNLHTYAVKGPSLLIKDEANEGLALSKAHT